MLNENLMLSGKNMYTMNFIILGILLTYCNFADANPAKCDRTPEGSSAKKAPPDGNFKLKISNDPLRYLPGESYNSKFNF